MKQKTIVIFLLLIIFLASFLRLWKLGEVPISPEWDEVALGYNAYSIMITGRDEYGKFLPIILRSFDDYKPALYSYLSILSIMLFDLTAFAVRLPSALFGILTIVATFFLVKELFISDQKNKKINANILALLTSFILAISPWHIQFSRIAFEANVGLALNVFSALFFFKGLKKPLYLLISSLSMALSLYTYQSEKVFVPLLFFILVVFFWKKILAIEKRFLIFAIILGFVISFPIMYVTFTNEKALARAQGVSIFSEQTELLKGAALKFSDSKNANDILGMILNNRRIVYSKVIISGYLSHFDLNWLFVTGDPKINRHHAPNMGLLYLVTLPFLLIGIYKLFFAYDGIRNNVKAFIFAWFFIAPIPASITNGVPHAVRTLNFLPTFDIFIALGIWSAYFFLQKQKYYRFYKYSIFTFVIILFMGNFLYYINQYFIQQNYFYALDWQYGYKETVDFIKPIQNKYNKIIVANDNEMTQSYMFFLFYLKYDPRKYLSEGGTSSGGFEEKKNKFSNFEFRPFSYDEKNKNVLLVGTPGDFPEIYKTVFEEYYPNKNLSMKVVEKE